MKIKEGDVKWCGDEGVMVLKTYPAFHLVKVQARKTGERFLIEVMALSDNQIIDKWRM